MDSLKTVVQNVQGDVQTLAANVSSLMPSDFPIRMVKMEKLCSELKDRVAGTNIFEFNGMSFSGPQDVLDELGSSLDDVSVGHFTDLFSTYCRCDDSFDGAKEWSLKQANAQKIKMNTVDIDLMATLNHDAPGFLFRKSESKDGYTNPEEGFGHRFSTFEKFSGESTFVSAKELLATKVEDDISGIRGNLEICPGDGKAKNLATFLLEEVEKQSDKLQGFNESWAKALVNQCSYAMREAWIFIGVTDRAMFDDCLSVRKKAAKIDSCRLNERDAKSLVIWAVIAVHIKMRSLIAAKFKSHQVVNNAMSNFIMKTRVDKSSVEKLDGKLEKGLKVVDQTAKDTADLKAEVKALKARLVVLEKHPKHK